MFNTFHLKLCFTPQRSELSRHLNEQERFHLGMCLAPQGPASQLPKVARDCQICQFLTLVTSKCASRHDAMHFFNISASKSAPKLRCLCILTSKCASRHNGVQFLISHLPRWLCTCRFCEPTFRPSGATKHWENVFSTFSHALTFFLLIFFRLTLSLLCLFPPLLLHLSILSEVLPSKLPSAKYR